MVHSGVQTESIFASVHGGWRLILADPVRVLFAAAGVLALQAGSIALVFQVWRTLPLLHWVGLVVLVWFIRTLCSTPFRAAAIAAGARALDHRVSVLRSLPSLGLVWLLASGLELLVMGIAAALTLVPAEWFVARGTWWAPIVLIAVAGPVALLLSALVRTCFAYAIIESTAGKRGAFQALQLGVQHLRRDAVATFAIVVLSECLVALGGLFCGAGALPATPYADLALLHRWLNTTEESE